MAKSNGFNPKADYVAKKTFKFAGKSYAPGDTFNPGIKDVRKINLMYHSGKICYGWQLEELRAKAAPKAPEVKPEKVSEEAPKEEKVEAPKEEKKPAKKKSTKKGK